MVPPSSSSSTSSSTHQALTPELLMKYLQDPSSVDLSKVTVDPGDIKMQMGKALTEEEFKAHCAKNNIKPQVMKASKK
jgi:hypothetical protein